MLYASKKLATERLIQIEYPTEFISASIIIIQKCVLGLLVKKAIIAREPHESISPIREILYAHTLSASFQNIDWSQNAGIAIRPRSTKLNPGRT
jgi:hypothetical protein